MFGKSRVEAFSDGVLAIVITIMVLELKAPHNADISEWGTANISEILYAKLYFHLKKPKTCTLRIWLFC